MLAKLTIELAKKGQFNAASLRARVLKEMKAHRQSPLGTDARLLHLAFCDRFRFESRRIGRTHMRTEENLSAVPMVVKLDLGMTDPEGVALEITYAQSRERFEAKQFDRAMYVLTIPMANEFLRLLETEMTGKGAQKH